MKRKHQRKENVNTYDKTFCFIFLSLYLTRSAQKGKMSYLFQCTFVSGIIIIYLWSISNAVVEAKHECAFLGSEAITICERKCWNQYYYVCAQFAKDKEEHATCIHEKRKCCRKCHRHQQVRTKESIKKTSEM